MASSLKAMAVVMGAQQTPFALSLSKRCIPFALSLSKRSWRATRASTSSARTV
jgi:hypothetical protein